MNCFSMFDAKFKRNNITCNQCAFIIAHLVCC